MGRTFTVYNCGTAFSRDNADETIATLAANTGGREGYDWLINAGPGSDSTSTNSTPGAFPGVTTFAYTLPVYNQETAALKAGAMLFAKGLQEATELWGKVSGYGWEHNTKRTVEAIKKLNVSGGMPITKVNMAGWSRGAITCFMIANALMNDPGTKNITAINIFGFDPVPGPGHFDDPRKTPLTATVKCYAAVLMQDEEKWIFKPVAEPEHTENSRRVYYPLPGVHSDGVFRHKSVIGKLATFLCYRFMRAWGTNVSGLPWYTHLQMCEMYAEMRMNQLKNAKKGQGWFDKLWDRDFNPLYHRRREIQNQFHDSVYFINAHHHKLFSICFPEVFLYFENKVNDSNRPQFTKAVEIMKGKAPKTWESLYEAGIIK